MALTRLDNLYSSKTGKYLYVSPDDFNATDELDNRGNSPLRPFKTIQRAFIEVARYSYLPGKNNDRFDQFSIMLMPGNHYIDNRPGIVDVTNPDQRYLDGANLIEANRQEIIDRAFAQIAIDYNESVWGTNWVVPEDQVSSELNRYFDAYRLIQKNRQEIIDTAYQDMLDTHPGFIVPGTVGVDDNKCKRDIGYYIDAVSLDVVLGGGNRYSRKFIQNYFNASDNSWLSNTLQGEETQSVTAFNAARDEMIKAVSNQLTYKDLTVTADSVTGSNQNQNSCSNIHTLITNLSAIITDRITAGTLNGLVGETSSPAVGNGQSICKRDIGYIVEAVVSDLKTGGNSNIIQAARSYFDRNGVPISNGLVGEEAQSIIAFTKAADMMGKAVSNRLYTKDLTLLAGPSEAGGTGIIQPLYPSGNEFSCVDVQNTINSLVNILNTVIEDGNLSSLEDIEITGDIPVFNYNQALDEWNDNSILDLSNPDNILYKFNASTGGAIVPRGCSLIGYDLRRTIVRPLYVPDPADGTQKRTSIFNLTGGCYLWQFTIKDGDLSSNSPLFDSVANVGKVYFQKGNTLQLAIPEYSHHKICIMEYADSEELDRYYTKVARAFVKFQPAIDDGEFEALVQENRIVGPLSDTRRIESIKITDSAPPGILTVEVTTKIDHGYFVDQYVAILNNGLSDQLNGTFKVTATNVDNNPKVFRYQVATYVVALGNNDLESGATYTAANGLNTNAVSQAEIDSVESASPYVFNCSIRSTWGLCGMWADGAKATGFKSMVVAQYTGVSLQKDDRAFIRYDRFTNTWNQASLTDAFATVPYHTKGDAYWKDEWRNFHIRASDDAFIQCVSVFAVGFFDHFLMESGGDMSITNSNSNFGNTSLHAAGFKGFAFNQDKGGYITDIIPPEVINVSPSNEEKIQYYTLDIQGSNPISNNTKLYLSGDNVTDPANRPAATIGGYRIGAKTGEKIYVKLDTGTCYSTLSPTGFNRYTISLETLNPSGISINNKAQDAANRVEDNKDFIANEAYQYIITKYPALLTNQNITVSKCKRDIGYFIDAVVTDLRLGGNVNTIQAAEGYFVGNSLVYIQNELVETIEALNYVRDLSIASMRNFDYLIKNCTTTAGSALVNVGDTTGLVIGMTVAQYSPSSFTSSKLNQGATALTTNITSGTYIKRIVNNTTIELGVAGSILNSGTTKNALQNSSSAWLYFTLPSGAWDSVHNIDPTTDPTLIQDTTYPECSDIASIIAQYFIDIGLTLNQGPETVNKIEPVIDYAGLGQRATIFTVNTGGGSTNPHQFETGTPVKLVPKAKAGTNVDKKYVRLPKGFDANVKYYVIAPGRNTQPYNYSSTTVFDGSDQTKLMLASTKENACAGIYIYSPETDSVHPDVEIEIQQYVLDETYDLHKYRCNFSAGDTKNIETDVAHVFDLPNASVTPQTVFFRVASDIIDSELPQIVGQGLIDDQKYYYARYSATKKFTIHDTYADAVAGINEVTFIPNTGKNFYVFADKRVSPLRFDAAFTSSVNTTGAWYLQVLDESSGANTRSDSILTRFHDANSYGPGSGKVRTLDTWFTRLKDGRAKEDRVYRFRYVIPKYLETVRNPLNGFVMKIRTDDKRRLIPQKIVLKPVTGNTQNTAVFKNPSGFQETIGLTTSEYINDLVSPIDPGVFDLSPEKRLDLYDPYFSAKVVETESNIAFTIQSARKIQNDYLEIIAFDHTIINEGLKNEIFTVVEISQPQGGSGQYTSGNGSPTLTWAGYSSGSAVVHKYLTVNNKYYLILRITDGSIKYNPIVSTTFTQIVGPFPITANLAAKPNSVGDPQGRDKSDRKDFLYRIDGANVYTLAPGDFINDDTGRRYQIETVEDVGNIEDTFYIFDIDEIQERIAGQQDGVYYLTAIRGNISPFPTGPGVGDNFKSFKFSQPISQLYPQNYKNDPVWFKQINPVYNDVPIAISAADNYVHGLVTINDVKNSETKEVVYDIISQPAFEQFDFVKSEELVSPTLNPIGGSNIIEAQEGNATSGSEDRKIPISGNSSYPTEQKLYVELRRPSIARSGNHTFEYLGFGPGNYSTGFPLRQEVILSDSQNQYAQSKREDGGVVFYTGLNSNGDLYIGNRKINAITGEETFLEKAELIDSEDDSDDTGSNLVYTFDEPVTFNDRITVEGNATFNNPVEISIGADEGTSLRIYSVLDSSLGDDTSLSRSQYTNNNDGDITLTKNRINAGIYGISPRQQLGKDGQGYSIRTNFISSSGPTNITPNQTSTYRINSAQEISYSTLLKPKSGDILLKGKEVGLSGSLGWIFANYFVVIADSNIQNITSDGTNITINWINTVKNSDLNIVAGSQLRISNFTTNTNLNGTWTVLSQGFSATASSCKISIPVPPANGIVYTWSTVPLNASIEVANSNWKEVGVIGSETLRTDTSILGDYKLGINTVARSAHSAYENAFVSSDTSPKANLDLVGNAYITGQKVTNYMSNSGTTKQYQQLSDAFIVGFNGDWSSPSFNLNDKVTLRVMTTNNGRVGINTTNNGTSSSDLDRTFVVVGSGRTTSDFLVGGNLDVTSGFLNTTSSTFDLASTATVLKLGSGASTIEIGNTNITNNQFINIGNAVTTASRVKIGDSAATTELFIHRNATNSQIDIGTVADDSSYISQITIGGAYSNPTSLLNIKNRTTKIDGEVEIGARISLGTGIAKLYTFAGQLDLFSASGGPSTVNFATSASTLSIGADAGTTTVNNSILVKASGTVNGNITLNGGLQAGTVQATRGIFSTTPSAHPAGSLINLNIDLYKPVEINKTLDTQGNSFWGGTNFLISGSTTEYFLPINETIGVSDISVGDYILIDRSSVIGGSNQAQSEIVLVQEILNANNASDPNGYRVKVLRGQEGTTLRTNHPDNCPLVKLVKSNNVSYTTTSISSGSSGSSVNITTSEFGGSIRVGDIIRIDDTELFLVSVLNTAPNDIQGFRINDGGTPAFTVFEVLSTSGNTTIKGTLDVDNTITLTGSTTENQNKLKVTNGASTPTTTFEVDSATGNTKILGNLGVGTSFNKLTVNGTNGNTVINGGNFDIYASDGTTSKLSFINGSGNLTISGVINTTGTGTNTFSGDLTLNGGDFAVNDGSTNRFRVNSNGTIDLGGINQYFSSTGARKWIYLTTTSGDGGVITSNINYFVRAASNLVVKLPATASTGDMIRFVDIGGALTYNVKLILRAPSGVAIQGDSTNTASTISGVTLTNYNGGEMIVTTPNAAFGLIYAGPLLSDGSSSGIPSTSQGWWLMEI